MTEVRFYAKHVVVPNPEACARRFRFFKAITQDDAKPDVTISGTQTCVRKVGSDVSFEAEIGPGECAQVTVGFFEGIPQTSSKLGSLPYRKRIRARRYLCEFRDN